MKWRGPGIAGGAASGAMGAAVASHARGTQYLRARTVPVNKKTSFQQAVRNSFAALASLWSSVLTSVQRSGWDTYGLNVTVRNSLGDATTNAGVNWYVGNNAVITQAGFNRVDTPPVVYDQFNAPFQQTNYLFTVASGGTVGTLTTDGTMTGFNGSNGFLGIWCSRPYSPGINYFNGPYRFTAAVPSVAGSIPAGNYTMSLPFPASGVSTTSSSGNQMTLTVKLSQGDGRISTPFQVFVRP